MSATSTPILIKAWNGLLYRYRPTVVPLPCSPRTENTTLRTSCHPISPSALTHVSLSRTMVFRARDDTEFTRYGGWIPRDIRVYFSFQARLALGARKRRGAFAQHEPPVQEFQQAIENDPTMKKLSDKIFLEASKEYNFTKASSRFESHSLSVPMVCSG